MSKRRNINKCWLLNIKVHDIISSDVMDVLLLHCYCKMRFIVTPRSFSHLLQFFLNTPNSHFSSLFHFYLVSSPFPCLTCLWQYFRTYSYFPWIPSNAGYPTLYNASNYTAANLAFLQCIPLYLLYWQGKILNINFVHLPILSDTM